MERMNQMPWEAETTGREALLFLVIEHRQHGAPVPAAQRSPYLGGLAANFQAARNWFFEFDKKWAAEH
jgi:hypothetical protein